MAFLHAHWERGDATKKLADTFQSAMAATPDWEIVLRFYAALHFVQTYFEIHEPPAPVSHGQRDAKINNNLELATMPDFCRNYRRLWELSKQVRYDATFRAAPRDLKAAREKMSAIESALLKARPALASQVPPVTH